MRLLQLNTNLKENTENSGISAVFETKSFQVTNRIVTKIYSNTLINCSYQVSPGSRGPKALRCSSDFLVSCSAVSPGC